MAAVGCPNVVACVVGLSRSNRKHSFEKEIGIGKSCLCYKFMYPGVDNFNDDHHSLFALHEFESAVLNNTHFLYWGHTVKQFDNKSSEKTTGVLFHVIEQTVIYQDITLRPFNEQVSKPNVPDRYIKRITGQIESPGKISYKSRDDVALRTCYQQYPSGISRYPRGYLVIVDVSQSGEAFEDQFMRAELVLDGLMKQKKKFVIVITKRDDFNPISLEKALTLKRKYHTQVVETSALSNLNTDTAFRILAHKVLQKKALGLSDHIPSYEEAAHISLIEKSSAKESFLTFLRKRVVNSDERLWAIEDNEESKKCVLYAGKLQTNRLFAEHVLELHCKKILLYEGVTENPELRREYLEEFIQQRSDLTPHQDVLRRWIDSYMSKTSVSEEPDLGQHAKSVMTTVRDISVPEPEPYHTFHPNPDSVQSSPALGRSSYTVITSDNGQKEHIKPDNSDSDLSDREYENYDPKAPALTPSSTTEEPSCERHEDTGSTSQQSLPKYDSIDPSKFCEQNVYQNNNPELCKSTTGKSPTQESTGAGSDLATEKVASLDQQFLPKESESISVEDSRPEADQDIVQTDTDSNQSIKERAALLQAQLSGGVIESNSQPMTARKISNPPPSQPNEDLSKSLLPNQQISAIKSVSLDSSKEIEVTVSSQENITSTKTEDPLRPSKQETSKSKDDFPESVKVVTTSDEVYVNRSVEEQGITQEEIVHSSNTTAVQEGVTDSKVSPKSPSSPSTRASASSIGEKPRLIAIRKKVEEMRRKKEIELSVSCLSTSTELSPDSKASNEDAVPSSGATTPGRARKPPPPPLPKPAVQKQQVESTKTSPHKMIVDVIDIPPPIPPPPKPEDLDPVSTEDTEPIIPPPVPNRTSEMFDLLSPSDTTTVSSMDSKPVSPVSPIQNSLKQALPSTPQSGNITPTPISPLVASPKSSTSTPRTPAPIKLLPFKQNSPKKTASPNMSYRETVVLKQSPAQTKRAETKETKARSKRKGYSSVKKKFDGKDGGGSKQSELNKSSSKTLPTTFIRMDRRPLPPEPFTMGDSDEGPEDEDKHDYEYFGLDYDNREYVNIKDEIPHKTLDDSALPSRAGGISRWHSFGVADRHGRYNAADYDYPDFRNYKIPIPYQESTPHEKRGPVPQGVWPDYVDGYVNTGFNPTSSLPIFRQPLPMVPSQSRSGYPDYDYPDMRRIMFRTLPTRAKPTPAGVMKGTKQRPPLQNVNWEATRTRTKSSASDYIPMASITMDDSYVNTKHPSYEDTRQDSSSQLPPRENEHDFTEPPPKTEYSMDDMTVYMNLPAPPSRVPLPPRTQLRDKPSPIPSTVHSGGPLQKSISQDSKVAVKPKPLPRARGRAATDATLHDPSDPLTVNPSVGQSQPVVRKTSVQNSHEENVIPITPTNQVVPPRNIRRTTFK